MLLAAVAGWEFGSAEVGVVSVSSGPAAAPPVTQKREFWVLMGYAVALGVFGAVAGLVFIGVIKFGGKWYSDSDPGWFGGHWWWVAVAAAAGAVVGLLRRLTRLPQELPGLVADLQTEHVDPGLVPGMAAVSVVSLIGGASLGPEKALGAMGGGAGSWIAQRRALSKEDSQVNTLAGFAGAYGGLFSSTVIVVLLILEVARPGGQKLTKALAAEIVSSSVAFGIYFAIAGAVFLDDYQVPHYTFQRLAAARRDPPGPVRGPAGDAAGRVHDGGGAAVRPAQGPGHRETGAGRRGLRDRRRGPAADHVQRQRAAQDRTQRRGDPGRGPARRPLVAKMLTFAVSQGSGFVGGPIFPSLFIGGTAGVLVHQVIPGVPLGLAFTCLLAAVPGAVLPAPFSMVLMAAFLTQVGALQTAPILIAVVTAFLTMEAVKYLLATRKQARAAAAKPAAPA